MCHPHRHQPRVERVAPRRDPGVRISDADREDAMTRLGAQATEGRLSPEELGERTDAALTARTYGELDALFADLPGRSGASSVARRRPARDRYVRAKLTLMAAGGAVWATVAVAQHLT